jgi:localization factor PodJL
LRGGRPDPIDPASDVSEAAMNGRHVRQSHLDAATGETAGGAERSRWDDALYVDGDEHAIESRVRASARPKSSRTAETLSSMASWIERAQRQLDETAAATNRLEAAAAEREPPLHDGSLSEALAAIRRVEERLTVREAPSPTRETTEVEKALGGVEARLDALAERIAIVSKAPARRPLKPTLLRSAVDEIRSHQSELESNPHAARAPAGLPALGTLARSQTAMLTTLRDEVAKLASRIEDTPRDSAVQRDVETLRRSMSDVARRDDLSRLEEGLQALTQDISELRRAGAQASGAPVMAELQAEIRRLSEQGGGAEVAAIRSEIRRLADRREETVDIAPIARDIEGLSHKIDRLAEGGVEPAIVHSLSDQIEGVRRILTDAGAPQALGLVDQQLAALRSDIAEFGGRQIGRREVSDLRATIDDLRSSLETLGATEKVPDVARAMRDFGQPIESTLATLVDKIERVEQRVHDGSALDHLERQIETLAARIGTAPARDPAFASLERAMTDILGQISSWRDGTMEAAERAARTAVAETLDAMPVAAEVERHLVEIGDRYAAAEERTRRSLDAVQGSLADVMGRLSSLENGTVRAASAPAVPAPQVAAMSRPAPAPQSMAAPRLSDFDAVRQALQDPQPSFESLLQETPPIEDEVLLEPGARPPLRPKTGAPQGDRAGPAAEGDDPADIKSSFIAAARRAAQAAAAAETQGGAKQRPSGRAAAATSPGDIVARMRRLIDSKRRPLLLAAAAIVLALGTAQIVRNQFGGANEQVPVAAAPAPAPVSRSAAVTPPPATAPTAPAPASAPAQRAAPEEVTATSAVPADPVTTQSITPAGSATMIASALGPETTAKEPARIGDVAPSAPPAPAPVTVSPPARPAGLGDPNVMPTGLKQAADRGNPVALYDLAARTAEGRGVSRDPKVAMTLFEKAAEKGLPPAQYRLGNIYERGIGVPRDIELAKTWYRRSAEGGNVRAMHNLAVLLADGGGAKPDFAAAVEWFTRAADHGVKDSQFNLAVLYARGLGTSVDLVRAYHWLAIAAQQGDDDAAKKRDEVAQRLQPADLARAKAGVERWRAMPAAVPANEVLVPPNGFPEGPTASRKPSREARV